MFRPPRMFNMGEGSALLVKRDPPPSFLNGQEKVGMILLISLAAVSITALAIVLIYHRRNINRQPQAAPSLTRRLHSKEVELMGKPIVHDLYIEHSLGAHETSLQHCMPISLVVGPSKPPPHHRFPYPSSSTTAVIDRHSHLLTSVLIAMPRSPNHMLISHERLRDLHIGIATVELSRSFQTSGS